MEFSPASGVTRHNEPTLMGLLATVNLSLWCSHVCFWIRSVPGYLGITWPMHQFILRLHIRQNMCWAWSGRTQVDV